MTEDEAKTKRCCGPMHLEDQTSWQNCIGSACMAWRWDYAGAVIAFDGMITVEQLERMKQQASPQHGFCGLAGKP